MGMVANEPGYKVELKSFHSEILNEHEELKAEQEGYEKISVVRTISNGIVQRNYLQVKQYIQDIAQG